MGPIGDVTSLTLRVRLNKLLRGGHSERPIEEPRLIMKVVRPDADDAPQSVASLLDDEIIYILADRDGFTRVLTPDEAETAKSLTRALKAREQPRSA